MKTKTPLPTFSFCYTGWSTTVEEKLEENTSDSKIKKLISEDIRHILECGEKLYEVDEWPFIIVVPYGLTHRVREDTKVKIEFDDNCKFFIEEDGYQVDCDGIISVTLSWKYQ